MNITDAFIPLGKVERTGTLKYLSPQIDWNNNK